MTLTYEPDKVGDQTDEAVLLRPLAPTGLGTCWEAITPDGEHRWVEVLDLALATQAGLDPQRLAALIALRQPFLAEPEAIVATSAGPGILLHRLAGSPPGVGEIQAVGTRDLSGAHAYLRERGIKAATMTGESLRSGADGITRVLVTAAWAAPATDDNHHTAPAVVEVDPSPDVPRADNSVALSPTASPRETTGLETPAWLGQAQPIPSAPKRHTYHRQLIGALVVSLAFAVGIIAGEHRTPSTATLPRSVTVPRQPVLRPAIPRTAVPDPQPTVRPTASPSAASLPAQSPAPAPASVGSTQALQTAISAKPKPRKQPATPGRTQDKPPGRPAGEPAPPLNAPVVTGRVPKPGDAGPVTVATAAIPPPR